MAKKVKNAVGAPRKYESAATLAKAVNKYFRSICYVTHVRNVAGEIVHNVDGEPIERIAFAVPPTVPGLCVALGITPRTWRNYCDAEKHPEFGEITSGTMALIESWLAEQLVSREKSVQGIIFNLKNNYGWSEKIEIEAGEKTRATMSGASGMSIEDKMAYLTAIGLHDGTDGP